MNASRGLRSHACHCKRIQALVSRHPDDSLRGRFRGIHAHAQSSARAAMSWLAFVAANATGADRVHDRIDRIEPASWWVGMQDDRLQLLVHGDRIAELEPALQYTGVSIESVERVENPNYLFLNLRIAPDTSPRQVPHRFSPGPQNGRAPHLSARCASGRLRAATGLRAGGHHLPRHARPIRERRSGERYRQGHAGRRRPRKSDVGRHGGDLQGIASHLDYIAGMGFTQLWLNPVLENNQPDTYVPRLRDHGFLQGRCTLRLERKLPAAAASTRASVGFGLIMDVVLNHCGSGHWWMRDPPTRDWFNDGGKFFAHDPRARDGAGHPHGAEVDRRAFTDGWFVADDAGPEPAQSASCDVPDPEQPVVDRVRGPVGTARRHLSVFGSRLPHGVVAPCDAGVPATQRRRRGMELESLDRLLLAAGPPARDGYVSDLPSLFDFPLQEATAIGLDREGDLDHRPAPASIACWRATGSMPTLITSSCFHDNHDMTPDAHGARRARGPAAHGRWRSS